MMTSGPGGRLDGPDPAPGAVRQCRCCRRGPAPCLQRVHTDSRSVQPGDLFIALRGRAPGCARLLAQAQAAGAAAAVVELGRSLPGLPCLEVSDTTAALGALAAGWRSQFGLPLVAVTGSNGKTTVTQMLASILTAAAGEAALATRGNFNNAIGVPLTLLRLTAQHRLGVVELGMNHPGEIADLACIAQPTIALVNNAQREHQEFMHTVQAVAEENGSVLAMLPIDGTAVFPADDAFTPLWQGLAAGRTVLTFGAGVGDVQASHAVWQGDHWQVSITTPHGPLHTALHIAGRHNVRNALAATACAVAAGVPLAAIAQGLQAFTPGDGAQPGAGPALAGAHADAGGRHLQRQPRFHASGHCRAGRVCPPRACWCWATWARWATKARPSTPRSGTVPAPPGLSNR